MYTMRTTTMSLSLSPPSWRPVYQRYEPLFWSCTWRTRQQQQQQQQLYCYNLTRRRHVSNIRRKHRYDFSAYVPSKDDRVSGMWHVPNPESTDYRKLVEQLPQLHPSVRKGLTTALFFVTPRLAGWFENGHPFHGDAINRIYQPLLPSCAPTSFVTVVDALPDSRLFITERGKPSDKVVRPGHEGVAVCLMDEVSYTPATTVDGFQDQSLINFRIGVVDPERDAGLGVTITLPAANTLFVNGRRTTMYRQMWEQSTDDGDTREWTPQASQQSLSSLNMSIPRRKSGVPLIDNIPLSPITPGRKIISSMGNVLRELQGDGETIIKASTELEAMVPQFIKRMEAKGTAGTAQVYAMVIPPGQESTSLTPEEPTKATDAIYAALWNKGRLLRVTGGGGGWGKKQGLLSLDTSVNFDPATESEPGMFPALEVNPTEESSSHIAELLPVGSTVQFYATWVEAAEPLAIPRKVDVQFDVTRWTAKNWVPTSKQFYVLGTTVTNESDMSTAGKVSIPEVDIIGMPRFWGVLSHSGSCFATQRSANNIASDKSSLMDDNTIHQFRMDVPNSVFRMVWSKPVPKPAPSDVPESDRPTEDLPKQSEDKDSSPKEHLPSSPKIRRIRVHEKGEDKDSSSKEHPSVPPETPRNRTSTERSFKIRYFPAGDKRDRSE